MNATLSALVLCSAIAPAQKAPGVEEVLKPELTLIEKLVPGIWIMEEFVFQPPRMITVDLPPKGRRTLWYMVYRVAHRGGAEQKRLFVPRFELVDDRGNKYLDRIIPKAQRAIQAREDPLRPLENSVTIVQELVGNSEEGIDNFVYGVAIWDGTSEPAPSDGQKRTTIDPTLSRFDIMIEGLSNGFKVIDDPASGEKKTQRKTLVLKFARPGDEFNQNEREIKYLGNEWIYR